ncbi:DUF397 domain-containing protein [Micromonospora inositola]|nr:DUF397 domain-containing protein [Micromonospora inositola]
MAVQPDPAGPPLVFGSSAWRSFVRALKGDRLS